MNNKKLLILGSRRIHCDIVRQAKKMGIYTIVTDWNDPKDSPAKLMADEYWNISLCAFEELSSMIKKYHIDGILTGYSENYLYAYQHLCEMNHLPCYATKEQFEMVTHKDTFKKICVDNGVPIVPQYDVASFDKSVLSPENKIVIKPVDNGGSRGICICSSAEDFEKCIEYALSYSDQKTVIIEKYMDCDDVSMEYRIQDGEVTLSSICDRYVYKTDELKSVTSSLIYPSKYIHDYLNSTNESVKKMFNNIGLRNGVLMMQAFVEKGRFYFYEMGYRLSGGRHYIFTENQNNTSAVEQLINFAITGQMAPFRISTVENPSFHNICSQIGLLCKNKKISKIEGIELLESKEEIIDISINYKIGDTVGEEGTTAQIFGVIHCVVQDLEHLAQLKQYIYDTIHVYDTQNNNMIINC